MPRTDPWAVLQAGLGDMSDWKALEEEAHNAYMSARHKLHDSLAAYAEELRSCGEMPPVGFLERLYWDELTLPVATVALFFEDCHPSSVWTKFKSQTASRLCWGGCGRELQLRRTSRQSGFHGPYYCDDSECASRVTEAHRQANERREYARRQRIARQLRAGVELPRYQPNTWTQLEDYDAPERHGGPGYSSEYVTTWEIDEVRRAIADDPSAYRPDEISLSTTSCVKEYT